MIGKPENKWAVCLRPEVDVAETKVGKDAAAKWRRRVQWERSLATRSFPTISPSILFFTHDAAKAEILRLDSDWLPKPLPVVSLQNNPGGPNESIGFYLEKELTPLALPSNEPIDPDTMVRQFIEEERRSSFPACYLDDDLQFEAMENKACNWAGHGYDRKRFDSIFRPICGVVLDLERALHNTFGSISAQAISHFWQSYQVHRHLCGVARELAASDSARTHGWTPTNCNDAVREIRRLINCYGKDLLEVTAAIATAIDTGKENPNVVATPLTRSSGTGVSTQPGKGDPALVEGRISVNRMHAMEYLGVGARQIQKLVKSGSLVATGTRQRQEITTESLRRYQPPK
jgi:hypothetical protein